MIITRAEIKETLIILAGMIGLCLVFYIYHCFFFYLMLILA